MGKITGGYTVNGKLGKEMGKFVGNSTVNKKFGEEMGEFLGNSSANGKLEEGMGKIAGGFISSGKLGSGGIMRGFYSEFLGGGKTNSSRKMKGKNKTEIFTNLLKEINKEEKICELRAIGYDLEEQLSSIVIPQNFIFVKRPLSSIPRISITSLSLDSCACFQDILLCDDPLIDACSNLQYFYPLPNRNDDNKRPFVGFSCNICSFEIDINEYEQHFMDHRKKKAPTQNFCAVCKRYYCSSFYLFQHMKTQHSNTVGTQNLLSIANSYFPKRENFCSSLLSFDFLPASKRKREATHSENDLFNAKRKKVGQKMSTKCEYTNPSDTDCKLRYSTSQTVLKDAEISEENYKSLPSSQQNSSVGSSFDYDILNDSFLTSGYCPPEIDPKYLFNPELSSIDSFSIPQYLSSLKLMSKNNGSNFYGSSIISEKWEWMNDIDPFIVGNEFNLLPILEPNSKLMESCIMDVESITKDTFVTYLNLEPYYYNGREIEVCAFMDNLKYEHHEDEILADNETSITQELVDKFSPLLACLDQYKAPLVVELNNQDSEPTFEVNLQDDAHAQSLLNDTDLNIQQPCLNSNLQIDATSSVCKSDSSSGSFDFTKSKLIPPMQSGGKLKYRSKRHKKKHRVFKNDKKDCIADLSKLFNFEELYIPLVNKYSLKHSGSLSSSCDKTEISGSSNITQRFLPTPFLSSLIIPSNFHPLQTIALPATSALTPEKQLASSASGKENCKNEGKKKRKKRKRRHNKKNNKSKEKGKQEVPIVKSSKPAVPIGTTKPVPEEMTKPFPPYFIRKTKRSLKTAQTTLRRKMRGYMTALMPSLKN